MPPLDRKLLRDLWRMRGQALAIALMAACGIASFVTMRSGYEALLASQQAYYEHNRFADVFASLKRAPASLLQQLESIPGVNQLVGRVVIDASLDVPGLDEPASARLVSLPGAPGTGLNRVHLRRGRMPENMARNEVLASEAFSAANRLSPGDSVTAVINGRKEILQITGIAISPEYLNEMKGSSFPDNRRFGVLWMDHDALAGATDMRDGFNDVALTLAPGASEQQVIERLDRMLQPYGGFGAYGRKDQVSHSFLANELASARVSSTVIPAVFLAIVAFLTNNILMRVTVLQRAQIALLKSFGYADREVAWHYVKLALLIVLAGTVAGIALGSWMGQGLAGLYARFYHFPRLEFSLSGFSIGVSALGGAASAIAGAWLALRRILRMRPAEAMRPEAPAHFRPGPLERLGFQRYMSVPLRMVLRRLERKPLKALVSILGLSMAAALVVTGQYTFDALNEIIRVQFRTAQRDDLMLSFNESRDASVTHALSALPGVNRVEPFRAAAVRLRFAHHAKKTLIFALGGKRELRRILDEEERPIDMPAEGMVLTSKLAEILGVRKGEALSVEFLEGQRRVAEVPVVRIVDEPIGVFAYMDMAALSRQAEEPLLVSGAYLAVDPARQAELYRTLKGIPAVASVSLREATLQSFLSTIAENMRINTRVLVAFACVIAFGVVYNAARIALSENAVELASLRILGFSQAEVGGMLLGEQALLVAAALPLGCLLGYQLAALLSILLSQELFRIPLVVSTRTYLLSAAAVLLSAVVSGALVWRRIRRLDMIEVLKTRE
ncbi:ABC transporter permease [Noviherbaspirillum sp. 17J57-3]|uniref:ABC transporter permease n=1 Tax=Noviherbaspirillum galbum TaxID=2709383 RepID=A0A6B3SVE7_9BURK|nr:ABC transporter permease [Noviherbaspirillum galbum]